MPNLFPFPSSCLLQGSKKVRWECSKKRLSGEVESWHQAKSHGIHVLPADDVACEKTRRYPELQENCALAESQQAQTQEELVSHAARCCWKRTSQKKASRKHGIKLRRSVNKSHFCSWCPYHQVLSIGLELRSATAKWYSQQLPTSLSSLGIFSSFLLFFGQRKDISSAHCTLPANHLCPFPRIFGEDTISLPRRCLSLTRSTAARPEQTGGISLCCLAKSFQMNVTY